MTTIMDKLTSLMGKPWQERGYGSPYDKSGFVVDQSTGE